MNPISELMERRNLARVEDLLREKALLASLRLPDPMLELLHSVYLRRLTARGLDRTLKLLWIHETQGPDAAGEAWLKIGKNDPPLPEGDPDPDTE